MTQQPRSMPSSSNIAFGRSGRFVRFFACMLFTLSACLCAAPGYAIAAPDYARQALQVTGKGIKEGVDYSYGPTYVTILSDKPMEISHVKGYDPNAASSSAVRVEVKLPKDESADLTVNNLNLEGSPAFAVESGSLRLKLKGTSTFDGSYSGAGLDAGEGKLQISGDGTLNAVGNDAGIKGSDIHISGGNIAAACTGTNGPGIGQRDRVEAKSIKISGGTVYAQGGTYAAGIGGGASTRGKGIEIIGGKINAHGGAMWGEGPAPGIGNGGLYQGDAADVEIIGGSFARGWITTEDDRGAICGAAPHSTHKVVEGKDKAYPFVIEGMYKAGEWFTVDPVDKDVKLRPGYDFELEGTPTKGIKLTIHTEEPLNVTYHSFSGLSSTDAYVNGILCSNGRIVTDPGEGKKATVTLSSDEKLQNIDLGLAFNPHREMASALNVASGELDLTISGKVTLIGSRGAAAIANNEHPIAIKGSDTSYLRAIGLMGGAAIGGNTGRAGRNITISSGKVLALASDVQNGEVAGYGGSAIGGGSGGAASDIQIKGGNITALANQAGAGIGGDHDLSNIVISGGTILAEAGAGGAGIGGSSRAGVRSPQSPVSEAAADAAEVGIEPVSAEDRELGSGQGILIKGGTVTARSGRTESAGGDKSYFTRPRADPNGAAIGSGSHGPCPKIEITGGKVIAEAKGRGAGIGSAGFADAPEIKITGGDVIASSGVGAGIGAGLSAGYGGTHRPGGNAHAIFISGGTVKATGGETSAGIGASGTHEVEDEDIDDVHGNSASVFISGGTVDASATGTGAGIGGSGLDLEQSPIGGVGHILEGVGNVYITGGNIKAGSKGGLPMGNGGGTANGIWPSSRNVRICGGNFHQGDVASNTVYGITLIGTVSADGPSGFKYKVTESELMDFSVEGGRRFVDWEYDRKNHVLVVRSGAPLTISMREEVKTTKRDRIRLQGYVNEHSEDVIITGNLTLDGVSIDLSDRDEKNGAAPIYGNWQALNLTLKGDNKLVASDGSAAIQVDAPDDAGGFSAGYALTLNGDGKLYAKGGAGAAAIGGIEGSLAGDITVSGGAITAIGGEGAAAIGAGKGGSFNKISLLDGKFNLTAGADARTVGDGAGSSSNGSVTIDGGLYSKDAADLDAQTIYGYHLDPVRTLSGVGLNTDPATKDEYPFAVAKHFYLRSTQQKLTYDAAPVEPADIVAELLYFDKEKETWIRVDPAEEDVVTYSYRRGESLWEEGLPTDAGTHEIRAHLSARDETENVDKLIAYDYYFTVTILPAEVTPALTGDAKKDYDGTTSIDGVFTGADGASGPAENTLKIELDGLAASDKDRVTVSSSAAYEGPGAGCKTVAVSDIAIAGEAAGNYRLTKTSFEADVASGIQKAPAPAAVPGELLVSNSAAERYVYPYGLNQFLPTLPAGCEWGVGYEGDQNVSVNEVELAAPYYVETADSGVAVGGGALNVPIEAVQQTGDHEVGTVSLTFTSKNYQDMQAVLTVKARDKVVPVVTVNVDKGITYGDPADAAAMSFTADDPTGTDPYGLDGMFSLDEPKFVPSAGTYQAAWTFTPSNNLLFDPARGVVSIPVARREVAVRLADIGWKEYDGTTAAAGLKLAVDGVLEGDEVGVAGMATWTAPDAGTSSLNISHIGLTGKDASNYTTSTALENVPTGEKSIFPAKLSYRVAPYQVKPGTTLSAIETPDTAAGADGALVAGELAWFSDAERTKQVDPTYKFKGKGYDTVTLYWRFTAAEGNPNYQVEPLEGETQFTIREDVAAPTPDEKPEGNKPDGGGSDNGGSGSGGSGAGGSGSGGSGNGGTGNAQGGTGGSSSGGTTGNESGGGSGGGSTIVGGADGSADAQGETTKDDGSKQDASSGGTSGGKAGHGVFVTLGDGSVVRPDAGGSIVIHEDGTVELPDGGTVTREDGKKIDVEDGLAVGADGKVGVSPGAATLSVSPNGPSWLVTAALCVLSFLGGGALMRLYDKRKAA